MAAVPTLRGLLALAQVNEIDRPQGAGRLSALPSIRIRSFLGS